MVVGADYPDHESHREIWVVAGLPEAARIKARVALKNDPTGRELLACERALRADEPEEPFDAVM